jgi:tetratricopeptide (TPR) repeat protein
MMKARIRLVAFVAGAALVALVIARGSISSSLVVRGDSMLYSSRPERALSYYRRAIAVDSADGMAVDRFAFAALMQRDRSAMNVGAVFCTNFLERNPNDHAVRLDRALLFRALGRLHRAEEDFAMAGRSGRDARAMTFAGLTARALGRYVAERHYLRAALSYSPGFEPARKALAKVGIDR